jgi:hypothetical protein
MGGGFFEKLAYNIKPITALDRVFSRVETTMNPKSMYSVSHKKIDSPENIMHRAERVISNKKLDVDRADFFSKNKGIKTKIDPDAPVYAYDDTDDTLMLPIGDKVNPIVIGHELGHQRNFKETIKGDKKLIEAVSGGSPRHALTEEVMAWRNSPVRKANIGKGIPYEERMLHQSVMNAGLDAHKQLQNYKKTYGISNQWNLKLSKQLREKSKLTPGDARKKVREFVDEDFISFGKRHPKGDPTRSEIAGVIKNTRMNFSNKSIESAKEERGAAIKYLRGLKNRREYAKDPGRDMALTDSLDRLMSHFAD